MVTIWLRIAANRSAHLKKPGTVNGQSEILKGKMVAPPGFNQGDETQTSDSNDCEKRNFANRVEQTG
jgi:hypothetical protein